MAGGARYHLGVGTEEPVDDGTEPEGGPAMVDDVDDEAPTPVPSPAPRRVETVLQEPLTPGPTAVDAPTPTPPKRLKHDPREVRRVLTMAFSAGELSKYAERWRVFTDREGSVTDGARQLVRALEARDKLGQLVESLRAHKPLFEWPEPTIEVAEPAPRDDGESPSAADAPAEPGAAAEATAAETEPASGVGAPIVDPFAMREPASQDRGVVIPKRWLVIGASGVAALLVIVIVIAATTGGEGTETASLAHGAADELSRSVAAVRGACKIDEDSDSARDALTAAFRRCSVPSIRPSRVDVPLPSRPKPTPAPQPLVLPKRTGPVSRRPACLDQCHQIHNQCKASQCGQEPASAAAYDTYQRCLSGCLSQYSRCRLTCR